MKTKKHALKHICSIFENKSIVIHLHKIIAIDVCSSFPRRFAVSIVDGASADDLVSDHVL